MRIKKCPICSKTPKLIECISQPGRKRIMVHLSCHHFDSVVFNTAIDCDNNTIIKAYNALEFDKYGHCCYRGDIYR